MWGRFRFIDRDLPVMEYSSEELNYFRMCRIVVKLLPERLRKIFKQEWDFRYSATSYGPWLATAQNGNDFYHRETPKGKKPKIDGRLLSIMRNGNSSEWDSSCLFSALLFSNSIGSTLGPTVHAAVDDLRLVRNDIAHITNDELKDVKFQSYVTRVLKAFNSLSLPVCEIEDIKNQLGFPTKEVKDLKKTVDDLTTEQEQTNTELDQVKSDLDAKTNTLQRTEVDLSSAKEENKVLAQEINSKIESFFSLPFMPPHHIIRRSREINQITGKMQELYDGSNGKVSTIYLSGNPGCGKSQLAQQIGDNIYKSRSQDSETGLTFVATLNAETLETLCCLVRCSG